jgi:hypothetical protein
MQPWQHRQRGDEVIAIFVHRAKGRKLGPYT